MKKILRSSNYLLLILMLLGLSLWISFGLVTFRGQAGLALALLGGSGLSVYFIFNISRLKNKNARLNFIFASNQAVVVLLIVAIAVAVNFLGTKIHQRFDLSQDKAHSLSDQSIQVVRNLKKDLVIKAFFSKIRQGNLERFNSLLELYRFYSNKIKASVIDPYMKPEMVKQFDIRSDGTMVFTYGDKKTRSEEVSEEAITNAIIKVSRQQEKTIYFTAMHGEPDIDSTEESGYSKVKSNLEKLSYKVKKLLLFQEAAVPADTAALVIAGPKKPFFEKEILLLDHYINKNHGRVLLLLNPFEGDELKPLLKKVGLLLEDNVVVEIDPVSRMLGGNYFMPVVATYPQHIITKNFDYATMFPLVRGLAKVNPLPANVSLSFLAATSANSWGETQYEKEVKTQEMTKNPEDKSGPLDIAAAIEIGTGNQKVRLAVVGDGDFIQNKYYDTQANGNFFNNIISWLAEEGDLIAIAPKITAPKTVSLTESGGRLIFFYSLIVLPLLAFMAGIGIWLYRRKL